MLLVMFDEETEALAKKAGVEIALPPAKLRIHLDSKIVTTQLGNEAGIASVPNVLGRAKSYDELKQLAAKANLGNDLVVQTPYGDSGRTTFFVKSGEEDWEQERRSAGEGRAEGDEAHQSPARHDRGLRHPPRHAGRAGDDRHHRLRRADALQGRLVRQRRVRPTACEKERAGRCAAWRRSSATGSTRRATRASSASTS